MDSLNLPDEKLKDTPITTDSQLQEVLNGISMVNTVLDFKWMFEFKPVRTVIQGQDAPDKSGWLVWVSFERPDTITGKIGRGRGRDEIIWSGTYLSGVVKTAWLLVELMVRHELMEGFRFHNQRIFNPHNSVIDLMEVQNIHDQRMGIKNGS